MNIGTEVLYEDKIYTIIFMYGNGYCEIRKKGDIFSNVELVKVSDIKLSLND